MGAWMDLKDSIDKGDDEKAVQSCRAISRVMIDGAIEEAREEGPLRGKRLEESRRNTKMPKENRDIVEEGWATAESREVAIEQFAGQLLKIARGAKSGGVNDCILLMKMMAVSAEA